MQEGSPPQDENPITASEITKTSDKPRVNFTDPQMIIAFSVALISLCALAVSIFQAKVMREQQHLMMEQTKAAVWPHLEILIGSSPAPKGLLHNISINNKGVGPAIIERVSIELEGKPQKSWKKIFEFVTQEKRPFKHGFAKVNDRVLTPNEEVLALVASNDSVLSKKLYEFGSKIKIRICYRSVFGDYWLHTREGIKGGEELKHEKTESCIIKEAEETVW